MLRVTSKPSISREATYSGQNYLQSAYSYPCLLIPPRPPHQRLINSEVRTSVPTAAPLLRAPPALPRRGPRISPSWLWNRQPGAASLSSLPPLRSFKAEPVSLTLMLPASVPYQAPSRRPGKQTELVAHNFAHIMHAHTHTQSKPTEQNTRWKNQRVSSHGRTLHAPHLNGTRMVLFVWHRPL